MYLDNEKISRRQLKRLIVFNIISISIPIIPRIATAGAGRDGLLAIGCGLIFALLFIVFLGFISKNMSGNLMEYSKEKCGKFISLIVSFFYIFKYFFYLVFCGRLFGQIINETLLEDTDVRFIILMLILISAYSASKGFEVRARITEILYYLVLIPLLIFLLMGLKSIDLANLLPLFTGEISGIIYGGYGVFIVFTTLEFIVFSMHYIREKPVKSSPENIANDKQEKAVKIFKNSNLNYILNALAIAGLISILLYVTTVGILGVNDTSSQLWSTVNMIQIVEVPGGFLQRHDALMIAIWMFSIFTLTSGFFYYLLMISKHTFNIKSQNYVILPYVVFLFAACIIPIDIEIYYWYFEKYMMVIGIPGSIIIPLIVVIIGKTKDHINKKKERAQEDKRMNNLKGISRSKKVFKIIILAFIIPISMSLTACSDMAEIEDRDFVQALGVDYKDGEISLSLESPDLPAYTDQGSSDGVDKGALITVLTGNDFYQIEEEYLRRVNKRIDFSHLQVIIIGRGILENKDIYYEFLEYIENRYEISRNTLIMMSDSKAGDIMNMNSKVDEGIGNFLHKLYRINVMNNGREEIKFQDLLLPKNEGKLTSKIPIISIEDESLIVKGTGFIQDGLLAYEADLKESDYINIARGYGDQSHLFIEDDSGNVVYVLKINKIHRTISFEVLDDKPYMVFRIEGDGFIKKGLDAFDRNFNKVDKRQIDEINIECNRYIREKIIKLIEEISKENQVDFLDLHGHTYGNKALWLRYEKKKKDLINDIDYIVEVNIGL